MCQAQFGVLGIYSGEEDKIPPLKTFHSKQRSMEYDVRGSEKQIKQGLEKDRMGITFENMIRESLLVKLYLNR